MSKPVVAIVGRPNVGKSTFFNRCVGGREAIVYDSPGVTRDRIYRDCEWSGHKFLLVDTGGIIPNSNEEIPLEIRGQVDHALSEADVIVFLVDGKAGLSGADRDVANLLRRTKKPIFVAVNKIDSPKDMNNMSEFYQLGLGEPTALSALAGTGGVGDLLDQVVDAFPEHHKMNGDSKPKNKKDLLYEEETAEAAEEESRDFSIAIVGRPNVGKSSLVNALCGKKRSIVSDEPGTTRDAVDTIIEHDGRQITLIDTAGIRRKSKVDYGVEAFSVVRAIQAIERCDVAVIALDCNQNIADQDQKIAQKIEDAGRACVVVFNKWDLQSNKSSKLMNEFIDSINYDLPHLKYAEVVFTSAAKGQRVANILEAAERARAEWSKRVSTAVLNQVISEAQVLTPPAAGKRGKRLRIYYATQVSASPPCFVLFVNEDKLASDNYKAYLERKLREAFGFKGSPIRLVFREKKEK